MCEFSNREAITRGIANTFAELRPVFRYAITSWLIVKEDVQVTCNDKVKVKKENIAFEVGKGIFPHCNFTPRTMGMFGRKIKFGNGLDLHIWVNSCAIIGKTD